MRKLSVLLLATVLLVSLLLVGCGSKDETTTTAGVATTVASASVGTITWDKAIDNEGKTATVTGSVMAVVDKGAGIDKYILQVGSTGDDGFNAMINYADKDKFDLASYDGKMVEVTGPIYDNSFELKAEIEVKDPAQIKIVGDAPAAGPAAYTADEAKTHYGENGSITGTVKGVVDMSGAQKWLIQLDATDDGVGANGMVLYANAAKFGDLNALVGKTVTITGAIVENTFQKKAEIELTDPSQMVVK
jgi:hypothetical protein